MNKLLARLHDQLTAAADRHGTRGPTSPPPRSRCASARTAVGVRSSTTSSAELMDLPHIETRCLDVCKGPVVVIHPDSDDAMVLAMIRSRKQRRDLRRTIVNGGAPSERLARRTVTGSKRRTALRRLHRSVRRHH